MEGHHMVIRKALIALATAGLVVGSTAAAAAPAARTASPVGQSEEMAGAGSFAWIIALLIAAGVVAVIASDDDESPTSP
jgi:hypothetical protein